MSKTQSPEGAQPLTAEDRTRALNLAYQFRSHPASRSIDDIEKAGELILSLLAAPAPQAPVALTDDQIVRIHEQPELAGARHESFTAKTIAIARAAIAEFCRVNGIPAPQTKEPKA